MAERKKAQNDKQFLFHMWHRRVALATNPVIGHKLILVININEIL